MKIGMNDPCPCGSGKKYKKCCWGKEYDYKIELKKAMREFEEFYRGFKSNEKLKSFSDLDSLYASLKSYNNELLEKANAPYYIGANFYDSMELAITSNAISLIKGIFQANYYSITNALNLRNLIECFTLLFMEEKGDISDEQKLLFVEQYKIIEYESYAKDDCDKYKDMLDLADLKARYESGKEKFLKVVGTESKLKRIINSRLPFLCNDKLANNEVGSIQPIKELCKIAHDSGAIFHTDAVQAVGHIPVNVKTLGVDLLSASAHKFNGPKGVGFLYIKNGTNIIEHESGGQQEMSLRAGTENIASIVGMAIALENNCKDLVKNSKHIIEIEKYFKSLLAGSTLDFLINGARDHIPGNVSLSFKYSDGEMLLHRLDLLGIMISTGAACDSKNTRVSHVLQAIKVPEEYAKGTIRLSFGKYNSLKDAEIIANSLLQILS